MRASLAGSFVTFTPGISRRKCCVSPRPRSSTATTSLTGSSAGTSSKKRRVASSISALTSSAMRAGASFREVGDGACWTLDLMPLQELAADHHALDLRGPLADQKQRRVAIEALDLVLLGVAVAAVDAQALLHAEVPRLRGEELGHPSLEVGALARILQAAGAQRQQPRGLDLRRHVGELELDRLVFGDRLAERFSLLGVAQRQLQRALGDTYAARGHVDAAHLQGVHHLGEALVQAGLLAAEDVLGRAAVAVEHELGGLDSLVAELLDLRRHVE